MAQALDRIILAAHYWVYLAVPFHPEGMERTSSLPDDPLEASDVDTQYTNIRALPRRGRASA